MNALHITRAPKNHKKKPSLRRPSLSLSTAPGLSPLLARPSPPPFSARVARPPGGGQGGWVVPADHPTDHHLPLHFPPERHVPAAPTTPLPLPSALIQPPGAPVPQSRVRSSCVSPPCMYAAVDIFSSTFHSKPPLHAGPHSSSPSTTAPLLSALCRSEVVPIDFLLRAPSPLHVHAYTAFPFHSP